MKKEIIKSELIELFNTNDKEAIKEINIFLDEPYVESDLNLVNDIICYFKDKIKEIMNSYDFIDDRQKVSVMLMYLCNLIGTIKHMPL